MQEIGRAIMLDEDKVFLKLYRNFLATKGYQIFTTDNPYKVMLYGKEIKPEVIFMDADLPHRNHWEFLQKLNNEPWTANIPFILLADQELEEDCEMNGIANVCFKKDAIEKLIELMETYCHGNQDHEYLILADYDNQIHQELKSLQKHHSCFLTHDLKGSLKYLQKNHPHHIVIKYNPEEFANIQKEFPNQQLWRIDSLSEIERHITH